MCLFLGNGVASIYSTFHITVIQIDSVIFMVLEVEPRTSYILNKYSITILYTQTNFHLLFWDRASLSFLVLVMNSLCIPDCSWFSCLCFWSNWDFRIVLPGLVWDSLFIYIFIAFYVYACFICMYVCALRSLGTEVIDGFEPPCECWKLSLATLQEQQLIYLLSHCSSPSNSVSEYNFLHTQETQDYECPELSCSLCFL